jgi:hypothetical protein
MRMGWTPIVLLLLLRDQGVGGSNPLSRPMQFRPQRSSADGVFRLARKMASGLAPQVLGESVDHNLYLDNSNVFIEGQRVYAARQSPGKALSRNLDKQYRLDFGKLIEITCGYNSDLGKLMFYGSEPPPTDSVWRVARQHGRGGRNRGAEI